MAKQYLKLDRPVKSYGDNWLKSNIDDLVEIARGQGLNAAQMAEADRILDEYKKRYSC